jgi:two-component system, chemotaxis family, sensor kinase CheA
MILASVRKGAATSSLKDYMKIKLSAFIRSPRGFSWALFVYLPLAVVGALAVFGSLHYTKQLNEALISGQRTAGVAGRIGGLGEQVSQSVLLIEKAVRDHSSVEKPVYQLQVAADRLDQLINAFNEGSETVAPDGVRFMVEAITEPKSLEILQEMNVIWVGIKTKSDAIILAAGPKKAVTEAMPFNAAELSASASFIASQQVRIEEQALAFSRQLEALATTRVVALEAPRNILLGLAVIAWLGLPAVIVFNRVRRARDQSVRLAEELGTNKAELEEKAKALASIKLETDRIMETIQEGLMLVDAKGVIGSQYSRELSVILRIEQPAGANLLHLLQRLLSEKMYRTTKDYFDLLFDARRKEMAVLKVNPLDDIEVSFLNPQGGFIHRHLGFTFRRVMDGARVDRVFVAVRDITAQVEMEKRLRDAEKLKERQLEILLGIVHASREDLVSFAEMAERELETINAAMRVEDFAAATPERKNRLHEKLQLVFRAIHNIKGNAGYLRLTYFQQAADAFESKVAELMQRPVLGGDDFLALVVAQAGLRSDLSDLVELQVKLSDMQGKVPVVAASAPGTATAAPLVNGLKLLVKELAVELGKEVDFQVDAYALHSVAACRQDLVRDVLIQLVRNALVHGVEAPAEREAAGKPRVARLTLRAAPKFEDGLIGLVLRDDGRGLVVERIRARAEARGLILPGASLPTGDVARYIFAPGFSTAETADLNAGRGVGLDLLKARIVDQIGGSIEVSSLPGQFCEFAFHLPEIPEAVEV